MELEEIYKKSIEQMLEGGMKMGNLKYTTITMGEDIFKTIKQFAKEYDMPISAVFRRGALELIKKLKK